MQSGFFSLHAVTTTLSSSSTLFVCFHFSLSAPVDVFLVPHTVSTMFAHHTQAEVATATGQLKAHADAVEALVAEETELAQRVQVVSQEYESKNAAANEHREKITKLEQQVSQLRSKAQAAKKRGNTAQLEVKKAANKSAALEKRKKEAAASVAALLKQHAWIAKEKQYFGQPGTCAHLTVTWLRAVICSPLMWISSENRLRCT
jgi:hypothetical protein